MGIIYAEDEKNQARPKLDVLTYSVSHSGANIPARGNFVSPAPLNVKKAPAFGRRSRAD